MGALKDLGILVIVVVLIIMGLGAAHVTAVSLQGDWSSFWANFHFKLPFGL